jgi:branched-chain amino acid transport system permease protein
VPTSFRRHQYPQVAIFLGLTALLVPVVVTSRSGMYDVNRWLIYSVAAIGFYWVFALAGRFAFSHPFMMALGAFTSAFIARQGLSPWLGILGALIAGAVLAALVGVAVRRASEFYFAIATLAVAQVGAIVFVRAEAFTGPSGIVAGVPPLSLPGLSLVTDPEIFWLLLAVLGVVLLLAVWIDRSPLRRRLIAARDNPVVARSAGIAVDRLYIGFYALGSAVGAVSGAIIGSWTGVVSNEGFGMDLSVGIFLMVVLGGMGSHWGPVAGAAFYVGVPRLLAGVSEYSSIIYSVVLLVTIVLIPDGLIGSLQRLTARLTGQRPPARTDVRAGLARLLRRRS